MCPHHLYAYARVNDAQAMKIVFTLLSVSLSFLPVLSLCLSSFFSFTSLLPQVFPHRLNIINYDLHLRIIQPLCFHSSRSTPLRKTLTVNHYLRIQYFQQLFEFCGRVISHEKLLFGVLSVMQYLWRDGLIINWLTAMFCWCARLGHHWLCGAELLFLWCVLTFSRDASKTKLRKPAVRRCNIMRISNIKTKGKECLLYVGRREEKEI